VVGGTGFEPVTPSV